MLRSLVRLAAVLLMLAAPALPQGAARTDRTTLNYRIDARPAATTKGAIHVTVEALNLNEGVDKIVFAIPAWKPGAYRLENWQRRIKNVRARDEVGGKLAVDYDPADERKWIVSGDHGGTVVFEYDSEASDALENWLSCEGPETLVYLDGATNGVPCSLSVDVPDGWSVVTPLEQEEGADRFNAPDYDTLADCPIEIGRLLVDRDPKDLTIDGREYVICYNAEPRFDQRRMRDMTARIVRYLTGVMGSAPYRRYYFIWHLHEGQDFTGGLEHLYGTVLYVPQFAMVRGVDEMASLVAHEFFHLWNVKRIRPKPLGPFDYADKVAVRSLWFSEGVTDYYADVCCVRAGFWSERRYVAELRTQIQGLLDNPGYRAESAEDASFAAFDRRFMAGGIDYYEMGKLLGLLLDIEIRAATGNKKSLDHMMRTLYERFAPPKPGFKDQDLVDVASETAGRDMRPFFRDYVAGKKELPFETVLAKAGLVFRKTDEKRRETTETLSRLHRDLIVEPIEIEGESAWRVAAPEKHGELDLAKGDLIVAVDGQEPVAATAGRSFIGRNIAAAVRRPRFAAAAVVFRVRRDGTEFDLPVRIPERTVSRIELSVDQSPSDPIATAIRDVILGRVLEPPLPVPAPTSRPAR